MDELKLVYLPVDSLTPYDNNARKHTEHDIEAIKESIKQSGGFNDPIGIWGENNLIVEGHGRLIAAKELGISEVPCIRLDHLTDEERRKYTLLHNQTNSLSDWDFSKLEEELADLDFGNFDFGFETDTSDEKEGNEITEDEPPADVETRCKEGGLWLLGNHRLICGDSTDAEIIEKLLAGENATLLLTDPPYGISVVQNRKVGGGGALHFGGKQGKRVESSVYIPVANDDTTDTARLNYSVAQNYTENQIIFGGNYFTDFLPPSRCWIVWDKQNTGNFADAELAWTSFDKGVRLYHFLWNGLCRAGSREIEGKTRVHPTQKPVGLIADILKDFSSENDSILDCFGGSGSTLMACEQTGRKCYIAELDPHYCDVIINRWETFTGKKAEKIS